MNRITLMGRLTAEPEVRYTRGPESMAIAKYTIAVDRKQKKKDDSNNADFFRVVAFGKNAEYTEKHFQKGTRVLIGGRVETGKYENRDGVKTPYFEVIADEQELAEAKVAAMTSIRDDIRPEKAQTNDESAEEYMEVQDDNELPFN